MKSQIIVFLEHETSSWHDLEKSFQEHNFIVIHADNFKEVIRLIENDKPDAVIIDWKHGRGIVQSIIKQVNVFNKNSVLVVRALNLSYNDQISLLEQGIDECFDESLNGDLVVAKISALMRRVSFVKEEPRTLRAKDVIINLDTQQVIKGNRKIELTFTQFKILYLLASKRDYVFTRDEILTKVWGENSYVTDRTVDVHVKRLREKLGERNKSSDYIQTIHGLGYRFA
ncbi:response regulator transcription factor [bacterium]|nr:response regulator transcription factor [bacterium]